MRTFVAEIYKDGDEQWNWKITNHRNRREIARSFGTFSSLPVCRNNYEMVTGLLAPAIDKGQDRGSIRYHVSSRKFRMC